MTTDKLSLQYSTNFQTKKCKLNILSYSIQTHMQPITPPYSAQEDDSLKYFLTLSSVRRRRPLYGGQIRFINSQGAQAGPSLWVEEWQLNIMQYACCHTSHYTISTYVYKYLHFSKIFLGSQNSWGLVFINRECFNYSVTASYVGIRTSDTSHHKSLKTWKADMILIKSTTNVVEKVFWMKYIAICFLDLLNGIWWIVSALFYSRLSQLV